MIRNKQSAVLIFFVSIINSIFHCANNGVSSGGGIDIGNPTKICVVDSLDNPVGGASVKLILSDKWLTNIFKGENTVFEYSASDNSGFVSFDSITRGTFNLQIDHPSGGAFLMDFIMLDSQVVKTIPIKKYKTISGSIKSNTGVPVKIILSGSEYSAPVNTDGSFTLKAITDSICTPVVMTSDSMWAFTGKINVTDTHTIIENRDVSFNSILIDDFEDSGRSLKESGILQGCYIFTRQALGSASYQMVPDGIGGGNALKGTLITKGAYALVGFFLGFKPDKDSVWDFSTATGLSFYAKGKGKLNVSMESDSIDNMGFYKHYSADIILKNDWQLFNILFDSLGFYEDANPSPSISWNIASQSIKRIEFNALEGDTVEFWLDDLKVNGIDFSAAY